MSTPTDKTVDRGAPFSEYAERAERAIRYPTEDTEIAIAQVHASLAIAEELRGIRQLLDPQARVDRELAQGMAEVDHG